MKQFKSFVQTTVFALLIAGGPKVALSSGFCLQPAIDAIHAAHNWLEAEMTKYIDAGADQFIASPRWGGVPAEKRLMHARADLEASIGTAQQIVQDTAHRDLGAATVRAQYEVLTADGALMSTRTTLNEAGEGVARMVLRSDMDDLSVAACQRGLNAGIAKDVKGTYQRAGYTIAEADKDIAYLHRSNGELPAGNMFTLKLQKEDIGAPAEIGMAGRLDRGAPNRPAEKVLHLGPDSDPSNPLGVSNATKPTGVDTLTQNNMYNMALNSDTLQSKFQEADKLATRIQNAWDVYDLDQSLPLGQRKLPPNMRYKFAYSEQIPGRWKPVLDDGTLAPFVKDLNLNLPSNHQLEPRDFVIVDLKEP